MKKIYLFIWLLLISFNINSEEYIEVDGEKFKYIKLIESNENITNQFKLHSFSLTEEEINNFEAVKKLGYLIYEFDYQIKGKVNKLADELNSDFYVETIYKDQLALLFCKIEDIENYKFNNNHLTGLWCSHIYYPGSYVPRMISFRNTEFIYKSHRQDIYQQHYLAEYSISEENLVFKFKKDLWPEKKRRTQDDYEKENKIYINDPDEELIWKILPIDIDKNGELKIIFIEELRIVNGKLKPSRKIYYKLSDDPYLKIDRKHDYRE